MHTVEHSFVDGDRVYIDRASSTTMMYYAMNRGKFQCPCVWKHEYGIVVKIHGNYIYCRHEQEPQRISAFYYRDLRLMD
jgi:hypothetical protein